MLESHGSVLFNDKATSDAMALQHIHCKILAHKEREVGSMFFVRKLYHLLASKQSIMHCNAVLTY